MAKFIRAAIDLGKTYFQLHGLESEGGRSVALLRRHAEMILSFEEDGEAACLELY